MDPQFPIRIVYYDGTIEVVDSHSQLAGVLEFYDSRHLEEAKLYDALGRPVDACVDGMVVKRLELFTSLPQWFEDSKWERKIEEGGCLGAANTVLICLGFLALSALLSLVGRT